MSAYNRFNAGVVNVKADVRSMVGELQKMRNTPTVFSTADQAAFDAAQRFGERVVAGLEGLTPLYRSLEWDADLRARYPDLSDAELKAIHADIDTVARGHAEPDAKADEAAVKKASEALASRGIVVTNTDGLALRFDSPKP